MNILKEHIRLSPYNLSQLAQMAGINTQQLHDVINRGKKMSANMAWKILDILAPVELGGWWVGVDQSEGADGPKAFIIERVIEGSQGPTIEKETHFEYPVHLSRDMITDPSDLIEWLEGFPDTEGYPQTKHPKRPLYP